LSPFRLYTQEVS
jgi:hypothetical protein